MNYRRNNVPGARTSIMRLSRGLAILARYDSSGDSLEVEDDRLWAGRRTDEERVSQRDAGDLRALGWFHDPEAMRWCFVLTRYDRGQT